MPALFFSFFPQPTETPERTASPGSRLKSLGLLANTATVGMAKRKSLHQCASTGNTSRLAISPNLEKVKTVRCFWEMKIEPEVIAQI